MGLESATSSHARHICIVERLLMFWALGEKRQKSLFDWTFPCNRAIPSIQILAVWSLQVSDNLNTNLWCGRDGAQGIKRGWYGMITAQQNYKWQSWNKNTNVNTNLSKYIQTIKILINKYKKTLKENKWKVQLLSWHHFMGIISIKIFKGQRGPPRLCL